MKKCNECGKHLHGRSLKCKNCKSTNLRQIGKIPLEDWTTLKRGDNVHISGGPYMEVDGTKHSLSENGEYTVVRLNEQGFYARKDRGYETDFFYMGERKIGKTGSVMLPHTLEIEIS